MQLVMFHFSAERDEASAQRAPPPPSVGSRGFLPPQRSFWTETVSLYPLSCLLWTRAAELHLSLVSTISVSLMRASRSADGLSRLICLMASWQ